MALEAYIPCDSSEVRLDDEPISDVYVVTLYDREGDRPRGSMTTDKPLAEGQSGRLTFVGKQDRTRWEVTIDCIEVVRTTAVGFEFAVSGPIERTALQGTGEEE